jgi:hypothetical protein
MRYPPIDLARDAEPSIRRLEPRIRKVRASHRPRPRERRESVAAIARYLRVGRSTLYRALDLEHDAAAWQATGEVPVTAPGVREPGIGGQRSGPG